MSDSVPRRRPGPAALYRYEVRIRTTLTPALTATFARLTGQTIVPRNAVRRLAVIREGDEAVDLPALVQRLTECDVAVLDVRRCPPAPPAGPRA